MISALLAITGVFMFVSMAGAVPQNLTEHSWIYNQGYMDDMRIYQTEAGFHGQKLVTGTRGTGTVSRTIGASVYGGWGNEYQDPNNIIDELSMEEWGVYQNKPSTYTPPLTASDLKNALCAKNYETGSVYSESYSNIRDLVKDTSVIQTNQVSVYDIKSEIEGTAKIGARVQKSYSSVPIYIMGGTYMGYTNMNLQLETGNASILTLPCP
jgi:hypothetical protein